MALRIFIIILAVAYLVFNLITAKKYNAKEMRDEFIVGQCTVGAIFANLFYAPAWALKLLKGVIVAVIK